MSLLRPYKFVGRLIQNESFEPVISWGIRMALSGTLPVIWGIVTGRVLDAVWITLTAEAISWVELKGSFAWRVRTLFAGSAFAVFFCMLGTLTGNSIWMSALSMFAVGFLATLLKNIGDRASGLAICVYLMFIISNAFPATRQGEVVHRALVVMVGTAWPSVVGIVISLFMPVEEPFRRQIALIWKAIGELTRTVSAGAGNPDKQKAAENFYMREKDVRTAINNSYAFYGRMVHQADTRNKRQYELSLLRKVAGLVAVNVVAIGEELEHMEIPLLAEEVRVKAASLFSALREATERISAFVITLRKEEKLLAATHINRLRKLNDALSRYELPGQANRKSGQRIIQLTERTIRLLENALMRLDQMGKDERVYRSYSLVKAMYVLQPAKLLRNLQMLFNFNTLTARYALRSAFAATVALVIYKWFDVDHGYWLPFSVMIVIQPYFGATFKKAIDRIAGTLLGGLAGSLLLHLPAGLHAKELILFATFILMVYYQKKNYSIAVFFITLNLVILFNLQASFNNMLMITRAICTIGGALLAVASGFLLLPAWDKKWLPTHLADAIRCNYDYFKATFFSPARLVNWTKNKRIAESRNSDVFDSFSRYIEEPGTGKTAGYYDIITYNVRITRTLNNIHLEEDEKKSREPHQAAGQQVRIGECLAAFNRIMQLLPALDNVPVKDVVSPVDTRTTPFAFNEAQMISLEKLIIDLTDMHQDLVQLISEQ